MNFNGDKYPQNAAPNIGRNALLELGVFGAFFAWLWIWLCHDRSVQASAEHQKYERQYRAVWNYPWNRRQRRMATCYSKMPASRFPGAFDRVISRGLSPTQRLERLSRISIDGRGRVYQFRYWPSFAKQRGAVRHTLWTRTRAKFCCFDLTLIRFYPQLALGP